VSRHAHVCLYCPLRVTSQSECAPRYFKVHEDTTEGEDQSSLAGQDDKAINSEPLEYAVLDHLTGVPHELMHIVKHNMELHQNLVRRLRQRNERLQALVAARAASAARATSPGQGTEAPAGTTTGAADGQGRQSSVPGMSPRQALGRTGQASRSRLSLEMPEANAVAARARLERACGHAPECLAATSRRARRDVEDCKLRASVVRLEREHMQAELTTKKRDKAALEARAVSLGAAIRVTHARGRETEFRRAARDRELEELRAELRSYRSSAAKMQALQL